MATVDSSTVSGRVAAALHDYRCATCGYGVAVARPPESCPMCQSKVWEHAEQGSGLGNGAQEAGYLK